MTNIAIDWLSVTVRAPRGYDIPPLELMFQIIDVMYLRDFWKRGQPVGAGKGYGVAFRIDDITFKLARDVEQGAVKQGICIEFTSNGLSIYQKYLAQANIALTDVLRDLRSLSAAGFKVNFPRLDVALDDICRADETPLLKMSKIYKKWLNREFCSRARPARQEQGIDYEKTEDEGYFKNGKYCENNKGGLLGRTLYFGNRKSKVCVRFYDKKTEQLQLGRQVNCEVEHWTRCEYEFHQERACAVVAMLIENPWDKFISEFCANVLGHLRFIEQTEKNRSRCKTSSWWTKFLNNVMHAEKFTVPPKRTCQGNKTIQWLRRSVLPSVYAYIAAFGTAQFLDEVVTQGNLWVDA